MIPIYIGSEPKTTIPKLVLQYSILKHTKSEVSFPGLDSDDNWKKVSESKFPPSVGTGFSLLRWDIPRRQNYKDFAIYLDADILCLSDIKDLYRCDISYPNKSASHWCTWQKSKWFEYDTPESSVYLVDCLKARNNHLTMEEIIEDLKNPKYQKDRTQYIKHMRMLLHRIPPQRIPVTYNHLNVYSEGESKFIHYTTETTQPWNNLAHPYRKIWEKYLIEALETKYLDKELLKKDCKNYKPSTPKERYQGINPYYLKYV